MRGKYIKAKTKFKVKDEKKKKGWWWRRRRGGGGVVPRVVWPWRDTNMAELSGPTYASLTPANPTIINGLAAVEMQTSQQLTHHPQQVMGSSEHGLVNMVAAAVLPASAPAAPPPEQPAPLTQDAQANTVDRNTLVAVLQFLKTSNLKVRLPG